jgi:cyanophycinase
MRIVRVFLALAMVSCVASSTAAQPAPAPKGHLVIIGGGGVPDVIRQRMLTLAGGPDAPIVALPQASEDADAGDVAVAAWKEAGATHVQALTLKDIAADVKAVEQAALIWFPGGDQVLLTKAVAGTPLAAAIRARYAAGAVVAGTSAGAAVMSEVMITGDADLQSITVGATKTLPGFALWPEVIVDQHFLKRQRHSRLISLVLEHPNLVGVAIDERTAVVVSGRTFEVMGESSVVVFDARRASIEPRQAGQHAAARNIAMHVLTAGMTFELGTRD